MRRREFIAGVMALGATGCAEGPNSNINSGASPFVVATRSLEDDCEDCRIYVSNNIVTQKLHYESILYFLAASAKPLEVGIDVLSKRTAATFFEPGQYLIGSTPRTKDPVTPAKLVALVADAARFLLVRDQSIQLSAEFEGSADSLSTRPSFRYRDEFGAIDRNGVVINGKPQQFILSRGDRITNDRLAVLRAIALYRGLLDQVASWSLGRNLFSSVVLKARVQEGRGPEFRHAQATIIAIPRSLRS